MNNILSSPKRDSSELLNLLKQLNKDSLKQLYSSASVDRNRVIEFVSNPANLNPSALFEFQSESANSPELMFKQRHPLKQNEFLELLKESRRLGATQIHLKVDSRPMARVDGVLCKMEYHRLTPDDIELFFADFITSEQIQQFKVNKQVTVSIPFEDGCFKSHLYQQHRGIEATLHFTSKTIPDFQSLTLPPDFFEHLSKLPRGIILVSGTAGSGKSTAILSLLSHINRNMVKNIVTIEDRLDYVLQPAKALISQKQLGKDTLSYEDGISSLSQEDPDVAYIARIPDFPMLESVLHLANSKTLVIMETNAASTKEALEKVLSLFPEKHIKIYEKLLQATLQASIHIKLLNNFQQTGQIPALEYFLSNSRISQNIALTRLSQIRHQLQSSKNDFIVSLDDYLLKLASEQKISYQEALRWIEDKSRITLDEMW
jgi:twitching motility protein PilT